MATTQTATEAQPGLRFLHQISSTPSFCEENVYELARAAVAEGYLLQGVYAAFISNAAQQISIWTQRCSQEVDGMAVWDYHVVLVALKGSSLALKKESVVLDVDSTLPLPCPLRLYARQALLGELKDPYRRLFRLVPASDYLETFASDRSHMLRRGAVPPPLGAAPFFPDVAGRYISPPPPYPCITSKKGETNTLPRYLEMPSHGAAAAEWRGTALETGGALPYGLVLNQDAFLDFMEHAEV